MALNINGGLNLTSGSVFQSDNIVRSSVQWSSSLSFIGSAQNIPIQGSPISVVSSTVTLDTADSTYDRFDLIIVSASENGTGTLEKLTGTPSVDPQYPTYNSSTQAPLKYVKVKANATVPSSAGINPYDAPEDFEFENVLVYNENTGTDGSPSEWNHYPSSSKLESWLAFDGSTHDANIPTENSYLNTDESKVGSTSVKMSMLWDNPNHRSDRQLSAYNTFAPAIFQYLPSEGNLYTVDRLAGLSFWIKLEKDLRVFDPVLNVYIHTLRLGTNEEALKKTYGTFKLKFNTAGIDRGNTSDWQLVILNADDLNLADRYINNQHIFYRILIEPRFYGAIPSTPDWYVYLDNIQFHLGSMPSDEVLIGNLETGTGDTGTGGNTGGGSNVYKEGSGPTTIRPTAGTHKVGALSYSSTIGGGNDNTITGSRYTYIGAGYSNIITGSDYSSLLGGRSNKVQADYSSILGGQSNCVTHDRSFIIGSNLTSDKACYTFMNNLDVAGVVSGSTFSGSFVGDGSGLTNIGGNPITVACSGTVQTTALSCLNFIGASITQPNPDELTVTISSGGGDITSVSGSGTVAGITLSGDTSSGDACLTLGGTFSTTTSSIVDFPTEVSRSAAAAGFGSGGVTELPVGGTTGQSLVKNSDTDYDVTWSTVSGGGGDGEYVPYITGSSSSGILPRLGSNCTTIGASATIAGGNSNNIVDSYSFIGGGLSNLVSQSYSAILGGIDNEVHTSRSSIAGGSKNCIHTSGFAFIGGGCLNTGSGDCSFIGGGRNNTNAATNGFLGGGRNNTIIPAGRCGAILGGTGNCLCNSCSFIIGSNLTSSADCTTFVNNLNVEGELSITSINVGENAGVTLGGEYSSILAGCSNDNDGKWSSIGGGSRHDIHNTATGSFIGAGCLNDMYGNTSFIGAGCSNGIDAGTCENFIGAGRLNDIEQGCFHGILAGNGNTISSSNADFIDAGNTIVGGRRNQILQEVDGSFIGNGRCNVITGSFNFSSIIGGECNTVTTANSHIIGSCITSDKANYTYVDNIHITGSTTTNGILQLTRRETTPTGVEGMIIASGSVGSSKLYYYDGSSWNALF